MLFVPKEYLRLKPYGTMDFSPKGLTNWRAFTDNALETVFSGKECRLYRIK
ncbi:MAG: hypothetical protein ABIG11_02665 [bacterium]